MCPPSTEKFYRYLKGKLHIKGLFWEETKITFEQALDLWSEFSNREKLDLV